MKIILTLSLLLLSLHVQADFTPTTCLELSRGYWVDYEQTGSENTNMYNRIENNCANEKADEMVFSDDHIQDIIKHLQLTGVLAAN